MWKERGHERKQRNGIRRVGTHNVQCVCCEVFVSRDGMMPDSGASLAQRRDMCRVLPGGCVRGEG